VCVEADHLLQEKDYSLTEWNHIEGRHLYNQGGGPEKNRRGSLKIIPREGEKKKSGEVRAVSPGMKMSYWVWSKTTCCLCEREFLKKGKSIGGATKNVAKDTPAGSKEDRPKNEFQRALPRNWGEDADEKKGVLDLWMGL